MQISPSHIVRVLALVAVTLFSGCVSYKASIPVAADGQPQTVHVLPALYDEEIGVQIVVADSSAATAQYGLIGALVGAAIDASINNSRAKKAERRAEVVREMTADFSLQENFEGALQLTEGGDNWRIDSVSDITADTNIRSMVKEIFDGSETDNVVVLTGKYQMTPIVDQVTLTVVQTVYPRTLYAGEKLPKPANTARSFAYHSPVRPLAYREYLKDEKQAVEQSIRDEYQQSIDSEPDRETSLRKAMEKELEEIAESNQIPETIAIRETWPQVLVAGYLRQAKPHIQLMVEHDWNDQAAEKWNADTQESFSYVASSGMRINAVGQKITELNGQTIYRLRHGDIVSVPSAIE
ncbi:MAG: hypothetical protein AAF004_11735 [Pseudomonadota bacterium]